MANTTARANVATKRNNTEMSREFKRQAKMYALQYAPKTQNNAMLGNSSIPQTIYLSAAQIISASEEIYKWLIKDTI